MPPKYVRAYSKGQKNDSATQRPTMKFVATKTADQLDLQALHRVRGRLVKQRTGIIDQIRAFLLERGVAVRQGLRFLRSELPGILAKRSDVLSPRMMRIIEDPASDWRRLDARIEGLSADITSLAEKEPGVRASDDGAGHRANHLELHGWRRSAMAKCSPRTAILLPGSGWCRGRSRVETAPSSARYPSAAIVICVRAIVDK